MNENLEIVKKLNLLAQLELYKNKGYLLTQEYNIRSSLEDIEYEYNNIHFIDETSKICNNILAGVTLLTDYLSKN